MKVNVTLGSSLLGSLATVLVVGSMVHPALAQDSSESAFDGEFSVQRFHPAPGPRNLITTRGARQDGKLSWSGGFMANYAYKPFVVRSCASETDCDAQDAEDPQDVLVVENMVSADFMGSLTVIPELQIGLTIPVTWVDGQGLTELGAPDPNELSAVGLGDVELEGKYRFFGSATDPIALAGGLFATAPFGTLTAADKYVGDQLPTFGVRAIGDMNFGDATVGANLVGVWRKTGRVGTTEIGPEFRYSVGAAYQFGPLFQVLVDGFGATKFSGQAGTNSIEALLGARVTPSTIPLAITAGGGVGVLQGVGVPAARGFLGLLYVNEPTDKDGDGVLDERDKCPTVAEDKDGYQDGDGCPEGDNDDDGIGDLEDKCPDQAEDLDDFEDDDGCPELDNDKDGIPDVGDVCPNEPETKNGYKDEDGCADEADTDEDGVPDARDKCPNEPEDTDGFQDTDGCPDPDNDAD
jgi:OOP family OmpA-OmpF porin